MKAIGLTRGVLSGVRSSGRSYNERRKTDDPAEQRDFRSTTRLSKESRNQATRDAQGRERNSDQPTGTATHHELRNSRKPLQYKRGHRRQEATPKTLQDVRGATAETQCERSSTGEDGRGDQDNKTLNPVGGATTNRVAKCVRRTKVHVGTKSLPSGRSRT